MFDTNCVFCVTLIKISLHVREISTKFINIWRKIKMSEFREILKKRRNVMFAKSGAEVLKNRCTREHLYSVRIFSRRRSFLSCFLIAVRKSASTLFDFIPFRVCCAVPFSYPTSSKRSPKKIANMRNYVGILI